MLYSTSPSAEPIFQEETSTRLFIRLGRNSSIWTMTLLSILGMDLRLLSVMRSLQIRSWERLQDCRSSNNLICLASISRGQDIIVQPRLDHQRLAQPSQLSYKEGVQPESSDRQRSNRACQQSSPNNRCHCQT